MVKEQAISQLELSAPDAQVSLVIRWLNSPALPNNLRSIPFNNRKDVMIGAFAQVKGELLGTLRNQPGVRVNDLQGSADAIVTAPALTWTNLVAATGPLGSRPDIEVLPNSTFCII